MAFIDLQHFGVPGSGRRHSAWTLSFYLPVALVVGVCGCSSRSGPARVEDSLTSGRTKIVSAVDASRVLERERADFVQLYPQAEIGMTTGSSRQAIEALFAAQCDLAVIAREMEPEERAAATRGRLEIEGYRFAKDAVVVVVHPGIQVENVSLDELRNIYQGERTSWSELGDRPLPIEPVFPPAESDLAEFWVEHVMKGEPVKARVVTVESDSAIAAAVAARPGAIGFLPLAWAERGTKTLRVSAMTGLPYWKPDLEAVYKDDYPLTRSFSLYVRSEGPRVAHGFITYVTSHDGQDLVRQSGLVPTTVPVRFVRRSPLKGAH
jgi:phosphate transport system substrate-binding protein